MADSSTDIVVFPEDAEKIDRLLASFRQQIQAKYILFCHRSGSVIAQSGESFSSDASTLSVLAAASFSSAGQIGSLVGETNFSGISHIGKSISIHISPVGESALFVQVFEGIPIPGRIDDYTKVLIDKFQQVIQFVQTTSSIHRPNLGR
jgi:predicted regulator of Ras-like GTPase activity (Roadblock/LC7/MglB family)